MSILPKKGTKGIMIQSIPITLLLIYLFSLYPFLNQITQSTKNIFILGIIVVGIGNF